MEEEVVFPALRDKRPSQVGEHVQQLYILTRLYFRPFYSYVKWRNAGLCIYFIVQFTETYKIIFKLYESLIGDAHSYSFLDNTSHSLHELVNFFSLSFIEFKVQSIVCRKTFL